MTREEAIRFANDLKNNYTIDFDKLPEFCDLAISALSENKGDLISRQAVLDYIDKMPSELTANGRRMIRRRTLEEYISDTIPSVENKGEWIPVSERLPKDGQNVLFCDIDEDIMIGYHVKGRPDTHFSQDGTYEDMKNVFAWRPLPEPYKEEKNVKETT